MTSRLPLARRAAVSGRYRIFHDGAACGEERWRLDFGDDGMVLTGEQLVEYPHPLPSRHEYRATITSEGRVTGLEVMWNVGPRALRAIHRAGEGQWHAAIEYQGERREQQGDYPALCEVDFPTHLFSAFILARRDFAVGGEHEFPVLRIGPPWMAVSPERMRIRCLERGTFAGPDGPVAARRYAVSLPPRPEDEGYTFWADEDGFVLESSEGLNPSRTWMRLIEFERGA